VAIIMSLSVHFSKIIIIQSTPRNELYTVTKLQEDLETLDAWYERGLKPELKNATTRNDLLGLLYELTDKALLEGDWTAHHFEALVGS
jgi:hypothetical protein